MDKGISDVLYKEQEVKEMLGELEDLSAAFEIEYLLYKKRNDPSQLRRVRTR